MKLALGLIFTNELPFLKLHLPVFKDSFDGIVAITDPRTTDASGFYLTSFATPSFRVNIMIRPWEYNWGEFATQLCNQAEAQGYDAIMRIDPDECLHPYAGTAIKLLLQRDATLLCFPRHEFFGDRKHVREDIYPDYQTRAWRLNRGIIVQGQRHEGVNLAQHGLSEHTAVPDIRVLRVADPYLRIFHYGWVGKQGIWRNMEKYQRHAQVSAGGPEHVAFPPDTQLVSFPTVEFTEPQPINPDECGIHAPFEE